TLLGAWPMDLLDDAPVSDRFRERLQAAMLKSVREARVNSSWATPNKSYEAALAHLIDTALADRPDNWFLSVFRRFAAKIDETGARIGLTQTVLKLTVPGVPDIYQGAELWEQSMVDPDNRRPVDFAARQRRLHAAPKGPLTIANWRDGGLKLDLIARLLRLRADDPQLFAQGSYEPLSAGEHIVAFERRYQDRSIIVAAALHPWRKPAELLPLPEAEQWREILSGALGAPDSAALAALSVAVWVPV
ncbi:MAG TPA: malto-oligosyltrehalose synthase, partial [Devosia sp.]|nr:malto-oligosyltrehalose synthase [Devosia sp.]